MSLLPFFSNKKSSNKFLVIEIDNEQLKVLVFYYEGNKKLKIIGSSVKNIREGIINNYHVLDKESLVITIKEAVNEATEELEEVVKDVIVGVKGPQCVEITTTAKSKATDKRVIKEKEINEVIDRITEAAYIQAQNDIIQTTGNYDSNLEIVTSSTVYSKIDNNLFENPIDCEGEVLESAVFNAFCFSEDIKTIKKVVSKAGLHLLAIAPIPYAIVQNITNMDLDEVTDYTLINFGLNLTEISIVFGKGLVGTKILPIGYKHLISGLSQKMGLTKKESEKVLETYSSGKLEESEEAIVQKCLNDVLEVWLQGLSLCFEEFTEIKTFASQIYLTGEGSIIPDVINMLKDEPWYKDIPFKTLPEYRKIDINDFTNIGDATGKITSPIWIPLQSLGVIYLEMQE